MTMTRSRRIDIPNRTALRSYLEQQRNPTVRLRMILLNPIAELPRPLSLAQIGAMVDVPEPTVYLGVHARREHGYQSVGHPAADVEQAAEHNAIALVFLPPDAPDLHPIAFTGTTIEVGGCFRPAR